jgi:hypothetical protein
MIASSAPIENAPIENAPIENAAFAPNDIDNLIDLFKSHENSHPTISRFWVSYLATRKRTLNNILIQGKLIEEQLSSQEYPDMKINDLINIMMVNIMLTSS